MVAQRRYRLREQRDKRESREQQNREEKRPEELEETMLLGRESSIVSCAQQTRAALFFANIVLSTTIVILCNHWSEQRVTTIRRLSDTRATNLYNNSPSLLTKNCISLPNNKYNIHVITTFFDTQPWFCVSVTRAGKQSTLSTHPRKILKIRKTIHTFRVNSAMTTPYSSK